MQCTDDWDKLERIRNEMGSFVEDARKLISDNKMPDDMSSLVGLVDRANQFIENCINDPMILAPELDTEEIMQTLQKYSQTLTELPVQNISAGEVKILIKNT